MGEVNENFGMSEDSEASNTTTVTLTHKVPAGKRWVLGKLHLVSDDPDAANHTINIQLDIDDGGSPANVMKQIVGNFKFLSIDLASVLPRSGGLEANDQIEIVWVRATTATAVDSTLWYIEKDV